MEKHSEDTVAGEVSVKDEEVEKEDLTAPDFEEEDEEALPHSEILDIFEEGLARLVQDPLLCDLPIQVGSAFAGLMGKYILNVIN